MPLAPPPIGDPAGSFAWLEWFRALQLYVTTNGQIPWDLIDKTGADISDLPNRAHNSLQSIQGGQSGEYYHLTQAEYARLGRDWICIVLSDETTAITTGTAKRTFRLPLCQVLAVRASLTTSSSSGNPTFDINESGTSILGAKLSIDSGEKTSTTAATPATITDNSIADDAEMTFDIDTAGTGAKGAKIYMKVKWL